MSISSARVAADIVAAYVSNPTSSMSGSINEQATKIAATFAIIHAEVLKAEQQKG